GAIGELQRRCFCACHYSFVDLYVASDQFHPDQALRLRLTAILIVHRRNRGDLDPAFHIFLPVWKPQLENHSAEYFIPCDRSVLCLSAEVPGQVDPRTFCSGNRQSQSPGGTLRDNKLEHRHRRLDDHLWIRLWIHIPSSGIDVPLCSQECRLT